MKKVIVCLIIFLLIRSAHSQSVGIGTLTPDSSAQLDVSSTMKGFLPPRMTITQRDAMAKPVAGLIIWCSNCVAPTGELQVFNGIQWTNMTGGISPSGTITICNQTWMLKNIDVDKYIDGTPIQKVTNNAEWESFQLNGIGAYCYYNNDSATYAAIYGKLYNWEAALRLSNEADGWHLPTDAEWTILENCLNAISPTGNVGGKMKETGTTHWTSPNTGATNSSGFTGLPGGYRNNSGTFLNVGNFGYWWSQTKPGPSVHVIYRSLSFNNSTVIVGGINWASGLSIRFLRD